MRVQTTTYSLHPPSLSFKSTSKFQISCEEGPSSQHHFPLEADLINALIGPYNKNEEKKRLTVLTLKDSIVLKDKKEKQSQYQDQVFIRFVLPAYESPFHTLIIRMGRAERLKTYMKSILKCLVAGIFLSDPSPY